MFARVVFSWGRVPGYDLRMSDPPSSTPRRPSLDSLAASLHDSYEAERRIRHVDSGPLPSRTGAIELLELLRDLVFPGYFTPHRLTSANLGDHTLSLLAAVRERLESLAADALAYHRQLLFPADDPRPTAPRGLNPADHAEAARALTDRFLESIPRLRALLALDVQAAYDGDPAAIHTDETIFCYPGVDAVFTYRLAHELHTLGLPLLPRIMSEYVHNETGIDIHPGATIGHSFFIDHGTGVVIGETTVIGDRVKLYQGVTLGAMSFPRDEAGRLIRGTKRHPTLEDEVIVYANATILGGDTVVGRGSIVGGSVFLTKSVPPNHYVTMKSQQLRFRSAEVHHRLVTRREEPARDDGE